VQLAVTDTGVGIPQKRQEKLFRPFATGDASLTRKHGGAGLGLVISREIARLLGGDVTIASREGVGTTAMLLIDAGAVDDVQVRGRVETVPDEPLSGQVLLVDDAADNRKLLSVVLRKAGMQVTTAENGEEACQALAAAAAAGRTFDIVVMDVQMPVLDGRDAATRMRAAGFTAPLVALTAHATAQDQKLCLAAGFDEYVTKPIAPRQLTDLVRRQLQARPT
jgi:CheY-like chemotaxis protein